MTSTSTDEGLAEIAEPIQFPGINRIRLGSPIEEIDRLSLFSDKQFEIFVQQWAFGYLKTQYNDVQRRGGAGDKGRDVIAWIDPKGSSNRQWDNYQCKHYDQQLRPSDIWIELGKLCHYTFIGDYIPPCKYRFVTHKGVGPKLADLLENPEKLQSGLINNWEANCRKEITKTKDIILEGEFEAYVQAFDFSIVGYIEPLRLLEEHSKTRYHAYIFGSYLKPRPSVQPPPASIAVGEARYVAQIYQAFSDHLKTSIPIDKLSDFSSKRYLLDCFNQARESFYYIESFKEFARDNLPDDTYFSSLMNQFYSGVCYTVNNPNHADGFVRMITTIQMAQSLNITAHALCDYLETTDRTGICHHLANEDKLHWVI